METPSEIVSFEGEKEFNEFFLVIQKSIRGSLLRVACEEVGLKFHGNNKKHFLQMFHQVEVQGVGLLVYTRSKAHLFKDSFYRKVKRVGFSVS